jgi:hypothetical protein
LQWPTIANKFRLHYRRPQTSIAITGQTCRHQAAKPNRHAAREHIVLNKIVIGAQKLLIPVVGARDQSLEQSGEKAATIVTD